MSALPDSNAKAKAQESCCLMGYVYFVLDPNRSWIKIGYSAWPLERVRHLSNSLKADLVLIGVCRGSKKMERQFHTTFRRTLVHQHEWFEVTPELLALAQSHSALVATIRPRAISRTTSSPWEPIDIVDRAEECLHSYRSSESALEAFRKNLNIYLEDHTATGLAGMVDISLQYLSDIRHGRRKITATFLKQIADLQESA